ncbi:MAG: hypothetical protein IPJ32_07005 [Sphingobacteriaceae bacterium]|nr:hypothetical protein [Sphingobacteriaceae bacterium]
MKKYLVVSLFLMQIIGKSQNFPGQREFKWPDYFANYTVPDSLKNEDIVVLNEHVTITDDIIRKRVAIKIQTEEGLRNVKTLQLPENLDLTNAPNWYVQGRFKDRKDPFIYKYKINYFAGRLSQAVKKSSELSIDYKNEKVFWVDNDGRRVYDYIHNFNFGDLSVGDILEYIYEAEVDWNHKQQVIYPHSCYPKLNYNLDLKIGIRADLKNVDLVYNHGIEDAAFKKTLQNRNGDVVYNYSYHFDYLKGYNNINYIMPGFTLPSISINHGAYLSLKQSGNNAANFFYVLDKYKWMLFVDTIKDKLFDKYHANIRKFIAGIPSVSEDSTGNIFASQLLDTLNKLKFISVESMHYGEIPQYAIPSSEQLLKGRLTEEYVIKNYKDFLSEKGINYYNGIVIDKRKAVINHKYRNNYALERRLIIIPEGNRYKYYVPRHRGVTYLLDELPFYFEGTSCVLMPCTDCPGKGVKQQISFLGVPKSTFNENVRYEAASIKVNSDSMKLSFFIKENLSGQFSTLLRHYYNNDFIDSTVRADIYKKCTDKPAFGSLEIKKGALQKRFPFKQTYNCVGNIKLTNKNEINLTNWFSFIWTKDQFNKVPNHEVYSEFQFTDSYNFLFEFDKPVEILNAENFTKKLSNEYFEVTSNVVKQGEDKFLLSVIVKVKKEMISEKDASKIIEFVSILDEINHLKLNYKIL